MFLPSSSNCSLRILLASQVCIVGSSVLCFSRPHQTALCASYRLLSLIEVFSTPVGADLSVIDDSAEQLSPFEGPEKLLEVWFTPSEHTLEGHHTRGTRPSLSGDDLSHKTLTGLRTISRHTWQGMLELVKCKVLSVIEGQHVDAYLLSESSMFVWPHKIILKTCGTTTLLLGLQTLLEIARDQCRFPGIWRLFYSRKTYMFPERQIAPHETWKQETEFLDKIFRDSPAYAVGKTNGDHWFLYLTAQRHIWQPALREGPSLKATVGSGLSLAPHSDPSSLPSLWRQHAQNLLERDCTLEILMTGLSPRASQKFYTTDKPSEDGLTGPLVKGTILGNDLAASLGIDAPSLIGQGKTDGYLFSPCGFSANMVGGSDDKRYATIHVTPEQTHSFASFESNVDDKGNQVKILSRILKVFEPKKLSITLFDSQKSKTGGAHALDTKSIGNLPLVGYHRVDGSRHSYADYDLTYLSFERTDRHLYD